MKSAQLQHSEWLKSRRAKLACALVFCCCLFAQTPAASGFQESASNSRPNIVIIMADDLGKDLGCYGNLSARTPNIDRFAAQATRFDRAFATTASCSASRSVILTGLHNHTNGHYGHEHGTHHFSAHAHLGSLPTYLSAAGYLTARIGKFHVAPESVFKFEQALVGNSRSPVEMAEACRPLLESPDERPFFLYFCCSDPHRGGGTDAADPHLPDRFGNLAEGYPGVETQHFSPGEVEVPPYLPDTPACRSELAQYHQSVSRFDAGVGRLLQLIEESGHQDNTLVIVTSDHGIAFPGAKTTCYEPGLAVPFLVRWPGRVPAGADCQVPISHVDLTPTLIDAAGALTQPELFQGKSRWPVWQGEASDDDGTLFASHSFHEVTMYYPMRVVRETKFKLIWNLAHDLPYPFASDLQEAATWQDALRRGDDFQYGQRSVAEYVHRSEFELYDLETDPHETTNLAEFSEYAEELDRLKKRLREFQTTTHDPWLVKWSYE